MKVFDGFSAFLGDIKKAFDKNPNLSNLLLDDFFKDAILKAQVCCWQQHCFMHRKYLKILTDRLTQAGWRRVVVTAINNGVPSPCLSTALSFYDGYRSETVPANLIQVTSIR